MGTKDAPGEYDCYENAAPDEPMFVLLARDKIAPQIVRDWAATYELDKSIANSAGNGPETLTAKQRAKYDEAMRCAEEMERWYNETPRQARQAAQVRLQGQEGGVEDHAEENTEGSLIR